MRRSTLGFFAIAFAALAGCGGGGTKFANKPRPASPVNLSVYINDARVSVSPSSVGAGEVVFVITNQASKAETLTIHPAGQNSQLATSGPINPQATGQVAVDFNQPGEYTVTTATSGTDAAIATGGSIQPASLHIGKPRPMGNGELLQP